MKCFAHSDTLSAQELKMFYKNTKMEQKQKKTELNLQTPEHVSVRSVSFRAERILLGN
jgi:hypothetical protein